MKIKKYDFFGALREVAGTDRRIRRLGDDDYHIKYDADDGVLKNNENHILSWPSLDDQKAKIWEVEPEEVFVWGACDESGASWIFDAKPTKNQCGNVWSNRADTLYSAKRLGQADLFPKDRPVKIKLVIQEDE